MAQIASIAVQAPLFGLETPAFDPALAGMERTVLGDGAWVDFLPGWLEGHESVYLELAEKAEWHHLRRVMYDRVLDVPRLTARIPERGWVVPLLHRVSWTLSMRYGRSLERISLAWYRDGRDSVAFHGDRLGTLADDAIVAIVSVGAPRRFLLRPSGGGRSRAFALGWGDLLVMGGTCQRTWQHAVPKAARADPRISIQFRPKRPDA